MKKDTKEKINRRFKIIEGQISGLKNMLEEERYCVDVIVQLSAVRQALSSIEDLMLENHLSTHVVHQMKNGAHKKATNEIIKIYKIAKKK